ncbi:uncharacterized protein [Mytilus edulis]|uniref:uncharacterized protein n=1 Tax=Mytilus edulis TaxID=6550 RepID=UPI0039EF034C
MEPDMVVEMLKGLDDKNILISQVVGDDDSTGFDRAKLLMPNSSMVKISDKTHIKHNIIKKVNDLRSKHRGLSGMVAESIVKNVSYVLEQNIVPQSDKLSKLGSSQADESVNNIIASKAPKTKHFSSSSSLNYRVSSAVLQKNEGYHYISELNTSIGLSPVNETIRRGSKLNLQRSKKKAMTQSKEWKKKRIFLKKKRAKRTVLSETKEGTTYQSSIGLKIDQKKDDIENIPDMPDDSDQVVTTNAPLVVFDLETTGLNSLNLFKQVVPGLASYSQSFLVNNLLGQEYESHNVHDARLLLKLITDKGNISNYLDDLAFSPNYPDQYHWQLCNLKTYSKVIKEKVISKAMALKAAKSKLK